MCCTFLLNMRNCAIIIIITATVIRANAAMAVRLPPKTSVAEESDWQQATATWYGSPNGDGSDGGACGYGSILQQQPFSSKVAAGSPVLFKGGKGCGECYQVKCMNDEVCSENPVTVVITDECPGGYCASGRTHFDLSGTAFSAMAAPGKVSSLLNVGELPILYARTACEYPGRNIAFHVDEGATDHWFSVVVEYEDGDGDIGAMALMQAGSNVWQPMRQVWGANWCLDGGPLKAPFSIRLQSLSNARTLTAKNVIPQNWQPNGIYRSLVNFDD